MTSNVRFENLVRQHKDSVYRQLFRMCGNHEDAEDSLAEALLKAFRHAGQLHSETQFKAWLVQIGRHACGRLKRKEALFPLIELSREEASPPEQQEKLLEKELKNCIESAYKSMPANYQEAYRLVGIQQMSLQEAADKLQISLANLKSRLHRARKLLRETIDNTLVETS